MFRDDRVVGIEYLYPAKDQRDESVSDKQWDPPPIWNLRKDFRNGISLLLLFLLIIVVGTKTNFVLPGFVMGPIFLAGCFYLLQGFIGIIVVRRSKLKGKGLPTADR